MSEKMVIYSEESTRQERKPMFWSNVLGWVDLDSATDFTEEESQCFTLPLGASRWVKMSEARLIVRGYPKVLEGITPSPTKEQILEASPDQLQLWALEFILNYYWIQIDDRKGLAGPEKGDWQITYWPQKGAPPKGVRDPYSAPYLPEDWEGFWEVVNAITADHRLPQELYFKLVYGWDKGGKGAKRAYASFDWKETGDSHPLYWATDDNPNVAGLKAALLAHFEYV